jgi:hypothetical protein
MAISIVEVLEGQTTNGSVTLNFTGIQQNDVVYVFTTFSSVVGLLTSGYTNIYLSDSGNTQAECYRKVMGGTPDASVQTNSSGGSGLVGFAVVAVVLRGVDTSTPEDANETFAGLSAGNQPDSPSITTVTDGALVISAIHARVLDASVTAPSGYTNQVDIASDGSFVDHTTAIASALVASAGAENPGAWSNWTTTFSDGTAATLAIRPAAAGGSGARSFGVIF